MRPQHEGGGNRGRGGVGGRGKERGGGGDKTKRGWGEGDPGGKRGRRSNVLQLRRGRQEAGKGWTIVRAWRWVEARDGRGVGGGGGGGGERQVSPSVAVVAGWRGPSRGRAASWGGRGAARVLRVKVEAEACGDAGGDPYSVLGWGGLSALGFW